MTCAWRPCNKSLCKILRHLVRSSNLLARLHKPSLWTSGPRSLVSLTSNRLRLKPIRRVTAPNAVLELTPPSLHRLSVAHRIGLNIMVESHPVGLIVKVRKPSSPTDVVYILICRRNVLVSTQSKSWSRRLRLGSIMIHST